MARKKATETVETNETVKPAEAPKTFTYDEVQKLIANAIAEYASAQPKVVQVSAEKKLVKMLFIDDCSDDNVLSFGINGKFGVLTGPIGYITVTRDDFFGEFRGNLEQTLLRERKLIVLDGLTDEERKMHGLDYKDGEVLTEELFRNLLNHTKELPEIFEKLCPAMRQVVATRFQTGFDQNDPRVTKNRDLIVKLNKISKQDFKDAPAGDPRKEGLFINILRFQNKSDE